MISRRALAPGFDAGSASLPLVRLDNPLLLLLQVDASVRCNGIGFRFERLRRGIARGGRLVQFLQLSPHSLLHTLLTLDLLLKSGKLGGNGIEVSIELFNFIR